MQCVYSALTLSNLSPLCSTLLDPLKLLSSVRPFKRRWVLARSNVTRNNAGCTDGGIKWLAPGGKNGKEAVTSRNLNILILQLLYSTMHQEGDKSP